MQRIIGSLFFLLVCFISFSQGDVKVYLEKRLSREDKNAIVEMTDLLTKTGSISFVFDSVNRFSGSGIYITTIAFDYFRKFPASLEKSGPEAIFIKSDNSFLYVSANNSLALQEALFIYLDKLGFRFYFPDPLWYNIPSLKSVFKKIELITRPDFIYRTISMGWGEGNDKLRQQHLFWERANCIGGSFVVNTGHAYNSFILDKKKEFEKHPEFLTKPLINGNLQAGVALNYSSDSVASLAYRWIGGIFDNYRQRGIPVQMQSLEPFDGNTYCELPPCKALGTTSSDQIIYFTNKVARKLKMDYPDKQIGLLAYNDHIDIPKYKVEDNIFITLTNGFNRSNYTTDELITRWRTKVKSLGIYDYMSVYSWDFDMPGRGLAGNYKKIAENLKRYSKKGVNVYIAESTYGWINKGLGHYIASKLLWNANADIESISREFFDLMFPQTKEEIKKIFSGWMQYKGAVPMEEDLYQWFSLLKSAFLKCNDKVENSRLQQIAGYLYYVKLRREYALSKPAQAIEKGSNLLAYMWQTLDLGIIASYSGLHESAYLLGPEYSIDSKNPAWKQKPVIFPQNKDQWIKTIDGFTSSLKRLDGIQQFNEWDKSKINENELKTISSKPTIPNTNKEFNIQYNLKIIVDFKNSDSLFLRILAGRLKKQGNAELKIYKWNDSLTINGNPLKTFFIKADGNENRIDLKAFSGKKYILFYSDNGSGSKIYFPGKMKFNIAASEDNPLTGGLYNTFYFFVPPGVSKFFISKTGHLRIVKPGKKFTDYETNIDLVEMNVEKDEAGWWLAALQLNNMYFIGIPPFITNTPESYVFPK